MLLSRISGHIYTAEFKERQLHLTVKVHMEVVSHINLQEGSWSHTLNRHEIWSVFGEAEALCITGLLAKSESVCISSSQTDPRGSLKRWFFLMVLFWPSQTWFSELTFLVEWTLREIPVRPTVSPGQDLAPFSQDLETVGVADQFSLFPTIQARCHNAYFGMYGISLPLHHHSI